MRRVAREIRGKISRSPKFSASGFAKAVILLLSGRDRKT